MNWLDVLAQLVKQYGQVLENETDRDSNTTWTDYVVATGDPANPNYRYYTLEQDWDTGKVGAISRVGVRSPTRVYQRQRS